jgi:hypothetical protein
MVRVALPNTNMNIDDRFQFVHETQQSLPQREHVVPLLLFMVMLEEMKVIELMFCQMIWMRNMQSC